MTIPDHLPPLRVDERALRALVRPEAAVTRMV